MREDMREDEPIDSVSASVLCPPTLCSSRREVTVEGEGGRAVATDTAPVEPALDLFPDVDVDPDFFFLLTVVERDIEAPSSSATPSPAILTIAPSRMATLLATLRAGLGNLEFDEVSMTSLLIETVDFTRLG
jgi:hypothetical protein